MTQKATPWQKLQTWANKHEFLFALWTLLIFLLLPDLVEPYWYGDEAIYLTIGTGLRNGLKLYAEIIDHKTPLIYYLAAVPNQLSFRFLLIFWMILSTGFFYHLAKRLLPAFWAFAASIAFVLLTSLPTFEGHIPNGELFVMGFILASLWLLDKSPWLRWLTQEKTPQWKLARKDLYWIAAAGGVAGLGILTKVPAVLDVGVIGALMLFAAVRHYHKKSWRPLGGALIMSWLIFGGAALLTILASLFYYWLRGSLGAYIDFGLLYNFHYTSNWTLPFSDTALLALFTLPGKAVVLAVSFFATLALSWYKKKETPILWALFWVWASTFAALLSNRPYPHYFQQVVPAFSFVVVALFMKNRAFTTRFSIGISIILLYITLTLLHFRPYAVWEYYQKYFQLVTGQQSIENYHNSFNGLVSQNNQIVPIIQEATPKSDRIFIWGTNPMLYAQAQRSPATRFTVAFHIHDLKVYEQTMQEVTQHEPPFIVVMKKESPLAGLSSYLSEHYIWSYETADMTLYRRRSLSATQLVQ